MASSPQETPAPAPDEVETLRRQVVELQRVSSLGVLAGGVCHELNNALTPILNYAKLGLRNPDPDYRPPGPSRRSSTRRSAPRPSPGDARPGPPPRRPPRGRPTWCAWPRR
jgi:hypothetical protein